MLLKFLGHWPEPLQLGGDSKRLLSCRVKDLRSGIKDQRRRAKVPRPTIRLSLTGKEPSAYSFVRNAVICPGSTECPRPALVVFTVPGAAIAARRRGRVQAEEADKPNH
jgi:hypothetical protein